MTEFNPGGAASLNAAVKARYEANADTNAFTDAEKTKLTGIATGAEVNPGPATTEAAGLMSAADKAKLDIALTETTGDDLTTKAAPVAADEVLIFDSEDASAPKLVPAGSFAPALLARNAQTGTAYTLAAGDAGLGVTMNNASANTVTIPAGATLPVGAVVNVVQIGAGATTITGDTGVTVNGTSEGSVAISARWQGVSLWKVAADEWVASGALA